MKQSVARMGPTGRRKAPPDDRLREIRETTIAAPHCASLHAGYQRLMPSHPVINIRQTQRQLRRLQRDNPVPYNVREDRTIAAARVIKNESRSPDGAQRNPGNLIRTTESRPSKAFSARLKSLDVS